MEWLLGILSTLGIFAAAIFILVFFHELGHFLAAKWFRMRVDQFSIGFPPKLFGFRKGETEYVLGATPLGGYVKIAGMIDESMDTEFIDQAPKEDEFRSKPVWQRIIVILAGVIFNGILAFVIYTGMTWHYGEDVLPIDALEGIYIPENTLAAEIGFRTGDRITGVNGREVDYFNQLFNPSAITGRDLSFRVERDGVTTNIKAPDNFLDRINDDQFLNMSWVLPSRIEAVVEGSPAEKAGIREGDRIVAFNGAEIEYWVQLTEKISESEGEISLQVERNGERLDMQLTPDQETNMIGIQAIDLRESFKQLDYNLAGSVVVGVRETGDTFTGIVQGLRKLFTGAISVRDNLGGPVAIANVTKDATEHGGWQGFWRITAFLSVTLAIMNMLPIPALDGGHFMFLLYEGITRREPSARVRMALQQIGFILLIGIFILVTFNDILRTIGN
ncbi:MAG: RIP metalloprotease RseP [Balneolaceae bacterium]